MVKRDRVDTGLLAHAIFSTLKNPTMPFSIQYRKTMENRLQSKKTTPTRGTVLTATRKTTESV
jgi:hypothetical protein